MEFKLVKTGTLKYDRIKSMSILRKELNRFGIIYSINDIKSMLDAIVNNAFGDDIFDGKHKYCFDLIFYGNEYEELTECDSYPNDCCFP